MSGCALPPLNGTRAYIPEDGDPIWAIYGDDGEPIANLQPTTGDYADARVIAATAYRQQL